MGELIDLDAERDKRRPKPTKTFLLGGVPVSIEATGGTVTIKGLSNETNSLLEPDGPQD